MISLDRFAYGLADLQEELEIGECEDCGVGLYEEVALCDECEDALLREEEE
jgi:hypothetical protein